MHRVTGDTPTTQMPLFDGELESIEIAMGLALCFAAVMGVLLVRADRQVVRKKK